MGMLNAHEVYGDMVTLARTHPMHKRGKLDTQKVPLNPENFQGVLMDAVSRANTLQTESAALQQAMITDPDSVDTHDVTIAMAKANLAVSMTKAVVDGALKAYREIISIR